MVIPKKVEQNSREEEGRVQAEGCKCSGVPSRHLVAGSR